MPDVLMNSDGTATPVFALQKDDGTVIGDDDALPVTVPVLGELTDDAEDDPDAASASIASILRGMLAEMQAQTALLTTIAANTAA